MIKKVLIIAIIISALLFYAVAGNLLVYFATANPYPFPFGEDVLPDDNTKPPTITISSVTINGNNITVNFKAEIGESTTAFYTSMSKVYYTSDWNKNRTYVYQFYDPIQQILDVHKRTEYSLSELNVPEGNHTITVYAFEVGNYLGRGVMHGFNITSSSSVDFTVDTLPPEILITSVENMTYDTSEIPLRFTINEPVVQVLYSLDGLDNVIVVGSTNLVGLSIGEHNVTVFATDEAGNTGTSETIFFIVVEPQTEPFPTTMVIAPIVSVAFVGVGLLFYFKKRKVNREI